MTEAQRNAISNPPVGLLVYQTNGQAFYYKDHFWWKILASNDNKSFMVGSIKVNRTNWASNCERIVAIAVNASNKTVAASAVWRAGKQGPCKAIDGWGLILNRIVLEERVRRAPGAC